MKARVFGIIYLAIIVIGLITVGILYLKTSICQSEFGPELNSKRRSLQIPIIPPHWHIKQKDEHFAWWIGKEIVVGHESKRLIYSDCELDQEIDDYFLKAKDSHGRWIQSRYKYSNSHRLKDSIVYTYQIGDFYYHSITKQQADSIFKAEKINKD